MRVLLVTTWGIACGIAEHSAMLKEAVEAADPEVTILPYAAGLDPATVDGHLWAREQYSVIHLNYHAALHSRWTPETIRLQQRHNLKVLVTYHDTGVPNADQCQAVINAADAAVVHEPFDDLPAEKTHYWRMGVPSWFGVWRYDQSLTSWCGPRPVLGSIGFPFPWKNYDQLARVTAECGWALLLVAPGATAEQIVQWSALNPHLQVHTDFVHRTQAVAMLRGCDATAFAYTCANTGQSGAILQGIAARKPVIALKTCRQFRALYEEYPGSLRWISTFDQGVDSLEFALKTLPIERVDARTVYVAEQESWTRLGRKYAALYRELAR